MIAVRPHRNITVKRLLLDAVQFFRTQRPVTRLTGPPFKRSLRYAEIDITYRCNLKCGNCNRSCTQAPSRMAMSPAQIAGFVRESIASGIHWERIRLLGGEPTLHPALSEILNQLRAYREKSAPGLRIVLCTNGCGERVRRVLATLPPDVEIKNTFKTTRERLFRPFNLAPRDLRRYRFADFAAGCRIIADCGLGVTPMGYYPCAVAGGIDRVFGFGLGRARLPAPDDAMTDLLKVFCPLCGHFGFAWPTRKAILSPTWKRAYAQWQHRS